MNAPAIRVDGLSKQYQIAARRQAHDTLRDLLTDGFRNLLRGNGNGRSQDVIWALRDVTLDVPRGQILGIIGQNGAGKSTLLKILARITEPTRGQAEIRGRLGSLLEVGTGFHPELTGRENLYLNGAILGMTRREIDRKFDEIVEFSEVDRFIDTPVKRYSSGMQVRLAFAVAAHLEPDILLVDEVLAVGDVAFQRKCLGKMSGVAREGRTVLFVSHNMVAIQHLCERAILLRQGRVVFDGRPDEAVKEYLGQLGAAASQAFGDNPDRRGNGVIRFTAAQIRDDQSRIANSLVAGKAATFVFPYENPTGIKKAVWGMELHNERGVVVADFDSRYTAFPDDLDKVGVLTCHVPNLPLPIGSYRVLIWMWADGYVTDVVPNAGVFDVQTSVFYDSVKSPTMKDCACMIAHEWRHDAGVPSATAAT